jgi:hypothetical protein
MAAVPTAPQMRMHTEDCRMTLQTRQTVKACMASMLTSGHDACCVPAGASSFTAVTLPG